MGIYINPTDETKEAWLLRHAGSPPSPNLPVWDACAWRGLVPVCLASNGAFTTAAVCDTRDELAEFSSPGDRRPKVWYTVSVKYFRGADVIPAWALEQLEKVFGEDTRPQRPEPVAGVAPDVRRN